MLALVLALLSNPLPGPPPLPEPEPIAREDRREQGRSPGYFLHRIERPRFGARLGLGVAGFLGPPVPVRAGFALDVAAVGRVPASRRFPGFSLFPELGYTLVAGREQTRAHLATAGLGLGFTGDGVGVALLPRLIGGALLGQPALGIRSGLLVELVKTGGFGLELSHQALTLGGEWSHAIVASLCVGFFVPVVD
jgi:hypothetical protein